MSSAQPNFHGKARQAKVLGVRQLAREEVAAMWRAEPQSDRIRALRDSHHRAAMCFAVGMRSAEVAQKTGYSLSSLSRLQGSPAFRELVEHYRSESNRELVEEMTLYQHLALRNMIHAERQLSDQLEAADAAEQLPPIRDLVSVVADRADRFGFPKNSTNLNVSVDFADMLARNRAARRQREVPTIEHRTPVTVDHTATPLIRRRF